MKKINKKAEAYKSKVLDDLLSGITPEEQKMTDRKMMLAAKIADAMNTRGMRKKDLAAALKVGPSLVTKWLSGTHNFTAETLWKIGDVLGIELISLEEEKEEPVVYRADIDLVQQVVNEFQIEYEAKNMTPVGKKKNFQLTSYFN